MSVYRERERELERESELGGKKRGIPELCGGHMAATDRRRGETSEPKREVGPTRHTI